MRSFVSGKDEKVHESPEIVHKKEWDCCIHLFVGNYSLAN